MQQTAKTLGRKELNLLGLMHSALDLQDGSKIYNLIQALNSNDFLKPTSKDGKREAKPFLEIDEPLAVADYSESMQHNYAGFGLKCLQNIQKGASVGKVALDLGLVSNFLVDQASESDDELIQAITKNTSAVALKFFPSDHLSVQRNRLEQHLLLTQQMVAVGRKNVGFGMEYKATDDMIKTYLETLPDLQSQSNIVCWEQSVLNEIDSRHLQNSYTQAIAYYRALYKQLVDSQESPYRGKNSLSFEEFLWAFNNVSSRHVTFHDHDQENDQNLRLILLPIIDLLNHSNEPNIGLRPMHDKVEDRGYVTITALRDIEADEQLTISYGPLSNIHCAQKYGMTLADEKQQGLNVVQANYPFNDYENIVFEEVRLKEDLATEKKIAYRQDLFHHVGLFPNKFEQSLLQRLRLTFLTSQTIMDYGGTAQLKKEVDFTSYFDQFNEECSLQFLIDSIHSDLNTLKPVEYYMQRAQELTRFGQGISSFNDYNLLNVNQLHIDELAITQKNLDYLVKLRKGT